MELTNEDREEIGECVKDGFTSGIIDSEDENGSYRLSWNLTTDKFSN